MQSGINSGVTSGEVSNKMHQDTKERIDAAIRFQSAAFVSATAYTNVILGIGYAAFFWLWSNTKDILPKFWMLVALGLMTVSVATFVQFEIYKMIHNARHFASFRRAILKQGDEALKALLELEKKSERQNINMAPYWGATVLVSGGSAAAAVLILLWHIGKTLLSA